MLSVPKRPSGTATNHGPLNRHRNQLGLLDLRHAVHDRGGALAAGGRTQEKHSFVCLDIRTNPSLFLVGRTSTPPFFVWRDSSAEIPRRCERTGARCGRFRCVAVYLIQVSKVFADRNAERPQHSDATEGSLAGLRSAAPSSPPACGGAACFGLKGLMPATAELTVPLTKPGPKPARSIEKFRILSYIGTGRPIGERPRSCAEVLSVSLPPGRSLLRFLS